MRASRQLWVVQGGIFLNMLGYGAVLPFEVIFLRDGRGFAPGVAGLAVGLVTGFAVGVAPLAGPLIDRVGARVVAAGAAVALAAGYAGLGFATAPGWALAFAAVAGAGNGGLGPSQSALLAALAPAPLRHRATALSRVAGNAGAGLGGALGGLVGGLGVPGYAGLFLANAVTYLLFAAVLLAAGRDGPPPAPVEGGYRVVLRDKAFVRLAATNVAMIAVGWGVFTWLLPPYAAASGVGPAVIGLLLLANAATVVVAQVPIARLAEGRRRSALMALAAAVFAGACVLVPFGGRAGLFAAVVAVGVGECLHTVALMPLAADLAPDGLRGRYLAAVGLSWWAGLAVAPALGSAPVAAAPTATFLAAAAVAAGAGWSAAALERVLPRSARLTGVPMRKNP